MSAPQRQMLVGSTNSFFLQTDYGLDVFVLQVCADTHTVFVSGSQLRCAHALPGGCILTSLIAQQKELTRWPLHRQTVSSVPAPSADISVQIN
jgi:hypothetical protein